MKKIILCILLLAWHPLLAQQGRSSAQVSRHPGAPQGFAGEKRLPVSQLQNFVVPKRINGLSYSATFYTFNDIAVFSYFDSTHVTVTSSAGTTILDTILTADAFDTLSPGNGFYTISGSKPFTALTGDAVTSYASGYFAVDQNGLGVSTKLNTWMMGGASDQDPHFVVFSYGGQTQFTLKDLATGNLLYEGSIDTTGYFDFPNVSLLQQKAIQVTSNRPVSALSYTDQGYYVPSANGTFSGNLFYGFSGYVPQNENSITLTSYSDNNVVVVTNLITRDTILVDTLNHWQVKTIGIFNDTFWKVSSSGLLTTGDVPFAGWGLGADNYYYLTQCADSTGKEVGTAFVLPTIAGDMEIFSYADNNMVQVVQLGDTAYPYQSPVQVKDTVLQNGGVCILSTPSGYNVFRVQSSNGVSVVQSFGGNYGGGGGFVPINNMAVPLPDLAVSQSDINFFPDTILQTGQTITDSITVHNYGTAASADVSVAAYDGNPDLGFAPVLLNQTVPPIQAGGSATLSFQMVVPPGPEYHSIYVRVDPNNQIIESNKSNNEAFKYLRQKNYAPYAVYLSAPGALKLRGDSLTPNPFNVTADIFNTTAATISNLEVIVSSVNGMTILSGATDTGNVSLLGSGHLTLSWNVQANKDSSGFGLLKITLLRQYVDTTEVTVGVLVPDTVAPAVPQGLEAQTDSSGPRQMMLTWTPDSTHDLAGYKLFYSLDSTNLLAGTGAKEGNSPIYTMNVDTSIVTGLTNGANYWFAISAFDFSANESPWSRPIKVLVVTKVRHQSPTPKTFALFQNFPNPFNPSTTINYQLPMNTHVTLRVYDLLGREVATLVNAYEPAGDHQAILDASKLASGVYFYRISAGDFNSVKKLVILK